MWGQSFACPKHDTATQHTAWGYVLVDSVLGGTQTNAGKTANPVWSWENRLACRGSWEKLVEFQVKVLDDTEIERQNT